MENKSRDGISIGGLTILPRLNSLNQDPGISLGQEDILTCDNKINTIITIHCHYNKKGKKIEYRNFELCYFLMLFASERKGKTIIEELQKAMKDDL